MINYANTATSELCIDMVGMCSEFHEQIMQTDQDVSRGVVRGLSQVFVEGAIGELDERVGRAVREKVNEKRLAPRLAQRRRVYTHAEIAEHSPTNDFS